MNIAKDTHRSAAPVASIATKLLSAQQMLFATLFLALTLCLSLQAFAQDTDLQGEWEYAGEADANGNLINTGAAALHGPSLQVLGGEKAILFDPNVGWVRGQFSSSGQNQTLEMDVPVLSAARNPNARAQAANSKKKQKVSRKNDLLIIEDGDRWVAFKKVVKTKKEKKAKKERS